MTPNLDQVIAAGGLAAALGIAYARVYRPWQLHWGASDEEIARSLPGDELVAGPTFDATRAITIQARPEDVWPWLVQAGVTRAGWYSYDLLDNIGRPSARRVHVRVPRPPDARVGQAFGSPAHVVIGNQGTCRISCDQETLPIGRDPCRPIGPLRESRDR